MVSFTQIRAEMDLPWSYNNLGYGCKQSIHYKTYYKPGSQVWQRLLRLAIVAWRNCGKSLTSATIQLLPGDVARVDVTVIRPWKFEAGQYIYLYIPSLGLWTSHPFSAAWESADKPHGSFSAMDSERSSNSSSRSILSDTARDTQRTVSFLIRKRDGFTKKMLKSVGLKVGLQRRVLVLAEGPFGTFYLNHMHVNVNADENKALYTRLVRMVLPF